MNHLPTLFLSHKSSYQLLHNKLPTCNHLRTFGCVCYATNFLPIHKLDQRAHHCIFVGYSLGQIGYWVYDLESNKFFSFVFHEHIFLFHTNPQEEQHDVVVLPLPQTSDEPITTKITETQANDQFFSLPPLFPSPVSTFNELASDYDTIVTPPPPVTHSSNRIKQPSVKLWNFISTTQPRLLLTSLLLC